MKKLHLAFGIIVGIMTLAAAVIALIMYCNTADDPFTGFPSWAPFAMVAVVYVAGLAVVGIAWLIGWLILRRKTCK